jgi:hypothetical protein
MTNIPTLPQQQASPPVSGYSPTPDEIREFQGILESESGVALSVQEAWDRAIELIALVRMLVSPYPEDAEAGQEASSVSGVRASSGLPELAHSTHNDP